MKTSPKFHWLSLLTLLCGGIGILLRSWLYGTGLDSSNLLSSTHPAGYLVLVLSLGTALALFLFTRRCTAQRKYSELFPASVAGGAGTWAGAVGILLTAIIALVRKDGTAAILTGFAGILAAAALVFVGLCRMKGRRPGYYFHTVVCVYFLLRLITSYKSWSSDPQLHDYCFQLLATVCIMLYCYHRAALDWRPGSPRAMVLLGLLGVYFCCLSLVRSDAPFLYAGTGVWMLTNLGSPAPPYRGTFVREDG